MSRKKSSSIALPLTGLILLFLAGLYIAFSFSSKCSLAEAEAAIKADGRPTEIGAILPPDIPDGDNASVDYQAAANRLREEPRDDGDLFAQLTAAAADLIGDSPDPDALDRFRALYESGAVGEALAMIEDGALKEGYRNDLDFSLGVHLELPHISELISFAKILAATVRVQAADGDQAGAWDTALTALRLANALEEEPLLISQLVRIGTMKVAIESIRGLDYSAATPGHLAAVDGLLARFDNHEPLVAAIDSERLMGESFFSRSWDEIGPFVGGDHADWGTRIGMGAYRILPPLRHMDRAARNNALRAFAANLEQPFSPEDHSISGRIMEDVAAYNLVTRATTPAIFAFKKRMTVSFAESRVTRAGIAAIRFREQHGSYPADLAAIGGIDVTDPFTGQPLLYRPEGAGFSISSVGANFTDDGSPGNPGTSDDIRWRYVEPAAGGRR
jgi:hypothetical protein